MSEEELDAYVTHFVDIYSGAVLECGKKEGGVSNGTESEQA